jgi:hypothetical protein
MTPIEHVRDDRTAGGKKMPVWRFRCECGSEKVARLYAVRSGATRSCGCARGKAQLRHGAAAGKALTPEYRAWRCMLTRAKNPNIARADRYSLRGIGVAAEWDSGGDGNGYERFLAHVGHKPGDDYSLDRIDNDKGYEPGNVRWATTREQITNRSATVWVEANGERRTIAEWSALTGIRQSVILQRINKLGWPSDRAVSVPMKSDKRRAA